MDLCCKRTAYLVWMTEKRRKSKADTLALLKYLLQSQHVGAHSLSVPGTVPGTLHVSSHFVLMLTFIILILKEHYR